MKLLELTGVKQFADDTLAAFLNRLITSGKVKVRYGAFAFVVIPGDLNYVYKVWTHDAGWETYMKYVRENPSDHVPRLIGQVREIPLEFKRPDGFDAMMKVCRVEKLEPLESGSPAKIVVACLTTFLRSVVLSKITPADFGAVRTRVAQLAAPHGATSADVDEFLTDSFLKVTLAVVKSQPGLRSDFHTDNVMRRGNCLVITDPYFSSGSMTHVSAADILQGDFGRAAKRSG